jgi:hypothetical protein
MLISRLLSSSLLLAVCSAPVAAQSSPENNSVGVQATEPGGLDSAESNNLLSTPNPKAELDLGSTPDRIHVGEYSPRLNQFSLPHVFLLGPDGQPEGDTLCYAMRSYKVARDGPQSDSTHAAGYSTCQPAARFHVHSIKGVIQPDTP